MCHISGKNQDAATVPDTQKPVECMRWAHHIADNKLTELAGWDETLPMQELQALLAEDFDHGLIGIPEDELDALLADADDRPAISDDAADAIPDPPADPITRPGDIWAPGKHRLCCRDATDATAIAGLLLGEQATLMFNSGRMGAAPTRLPVSSIVLIFNVSASMPSGTLRHCRRLEGACFMPHHAPSPSALIAVCRSSDVAHRCWADTRIHAVANAQGLRGGHQFGREGRSNRPLYINPIVAHAGLARFAGLGDQRAFHRLVQIGIIEHDERRIAASGCCPRGSPR